MIESRLRGLAEKLGAIETGDFEKWKRNTPLRLSDEREVRLWWLETPDGAFYILGEINMLAPPTQKRNTRKEFYEALFRVINTKDPMLVLFYMTPERIARAAADVLEVEDDQKS